jgi:hypothetical protein
MRWIYIFIRTHTPVGTLWHIYYVEGMHELPRILYVMLRLAVHEIGFVLRFTEQPDNLVDCMKVLQCSESA